MEISEILRRPYRRVLIPDVESGTFTAMIAEFPGCISEGDSPSEAYENLEEAAESWLEAAIEGGIPIPQPEAGSDYSGRVVLRMPRSIHRRAAAAAERENVSLNTFLVAAVSERLGQVSLRRELAALRRELLDAAWIYPLRSSSIMYGPNVILGQGGTAPVIEGVHYVDQSRDPFQVYAGEAAMAGGQR